MRFATIFAGYLIALSIDANALYENFSGLLLVAVIFVALYLDILTLSFDNVKEMQKFVKDNKKQPKGE